MMIAAKMVDTAINMVQLQEQRLHSSTATIEVIKKVARIAEGNQL